MPAYTRGSVSLSRGGHAEASLSLSWGLGRKPGARLYTPKRLSLSWGPRRKPGASLYTRQRLCLSHGGQDEHLVPTYTRGSVSVSLMGGRVKLWCLLIRAGACLYTRKRLCLSHGGQGESLVPAYTRGSVSVSLMGARVTVWCLLIHAKASPSLSWGPRRKSGACFYVMHAEASLSRAKVWCLLIHAEASLSRGPLRKPGASLYTRKRQPLLTGYCVCKPVHVARPIKGVTITSHNSPLFVLCHRLALLVVGAYLNNVTY